MVSNNFLRGSMVVVGIMFQSCICQPIVSEEFYDHIRHLATDPRVHYDDAQMTPMARERRQVPVYFQGSPRTARYAQIVSVASPARQYGYRDQTVVVVPEQTNRYSGYPNTAPQTTVVVVPEETGYRRTGYNG